MDISVVIPLFNEEESIPELFAWIERVMKANGFSYEVIFVNDGSTDRSWEIIEQLKNQSPFVKGIKSAVTTANHRPYTADSKRRKGMLSSPWMPTCKIAPTKYRSSTA